MTIVCPQCQHKNPDDAEFCENCGAQLPVPTPAGVAMGAPATPVAASAPDGLVCPTCKAPYAVGDAFCFNCGTDLTKLAANQPAGASAVPATGNGQATPAAPPAQPTGMSEDDWDKAFSGPASSAGPAAPPPVAAVATADPVSAPPVAPPSTNGGNAFSAPVDPTVVSTPVNAPATPVATGAMKLHIAGPYGDDILEYNGRELLLGRQDAKTRVFPDVNLDDSAASRRHLSIWRDEDQGTYYAQDLESSNGTSLNGRDMEPGAPIQLNSGDVIKIGTRYSIQVRIG